MSSLPDRKRPGLLRPSRVLVASAARIAAAVTWRLTHPRLRERYVEQTCPAPVPRLYYDTVDGWKIPIRVLPTVPGASCEPIVLASGLGFGSHLFRLGPEGGLAGLLQQAGYQVYLLGHRGGADAIAPAAKNVEVNFDAIIERDLEPALQRILDHSGADRVLWLGLGLGGQLGLVGASGAARDYFAGLAVIDAPIRFRVAESSVQTRVTLSKLVPGHWRLPSQGAARAIAVAAGEQPWCIDLFGQDASMPRVRGILEYASHDVSAGLLSQVLEWSTKGRLVSVGGYLDYVARMAHGTSPLLVVHPTGELEASASPDWGGSDITELPLPKSGLLVSASLHNESFQSTREAILEWFNGHRQNCWNVCKVEDALELAG